MPMDNPRPTSLEAYNAIVSSGEVSKARLRVYRLLSCHGPMTGSELNKVCDEVGVKGHQHKRLSELRDHGIVDEVGTRPCRVTGRNAIVWAINGRSDVSPLVRRKDTKKALREEIQTLKSRLHKALIAIEGQRLEMQRMRFQNKRLKDILEKGGSHEVL